MLVYRIIDYSYENLYTIKTLHKLEKEFNYSYNYLSAIFTKTSEKLNYSSIHNFSRAFKQYFGINPKEVVKK